MQYGISCRDILIIWCIEMKRDRNLMGSLLRVSERDLFFFRKEVIIISRNIVDNDTIYGWIIYIYIYMGRLKNTGQLRRRYADANSLVFIYRRKWVILCNNFRYDTGKKKKKKKTLIITSERKSSLDDIYASHRNKYRYPSFPLIIIYYNQE